MSTPSMVPMLSPDGRSGDIPADKVQDAVKAGFKPAYSMTSPDGKTGYIPQDRYQDAAKAGFKLNTEPGVRVVGTNGAGQPILGPEDQPSTLSLYGKALFNPVGSGAHDQGIVGGIEQAAGRGMQAITSPVLHLPSTLKGMYESAVEASPFAAQMQPEGGPITNRVRQFGQEWKQSPALAVENAAGDLAGAVEGGRLANAAVQGVKPSPSLPARVNSAMPAAMEQGVLPATAQAIKDAWSSAKAATPKLFPEGPPESIMTKAVRPGKNNVNWNSDVQQAVPLMKSAEQQLGHPIENIDDAIQAVDVAKRNIWNQVKARLGPAAQMGATIDGNQIADAMLNSIDKRTAMQNPGLVQQVKAVADTYRRPMSVDEAEDFLQSNNKELIGYYAKNKVSRAAAEADPAVAYKVAEGDALRNALYGKLDSLNGPGVAQLKKAYGSLTNMDKELTGRQMVFARQAPVNLPEQLSYLQAGGKILTGNVVGGFKDIAIQKYLSELNNTDSMISRAFQKAKPAQPFPAPSSPRFAGLLPRGPIQMPAPEDVSGPSAPPPPFNYTTRAQRMGLLLPEKSGAPTMLPYTPEMSPGEQFAALMHYLRTHRPPTALPSNASAIPLPPPK